MTNDKPCIETQPKRKEKNFFNVCKCGHGDFNHNFKHRLYGLGNIQFLECKKCMCNEYNELGRFTYDEWMNLKSCDKNE